MQTIYLIRHAKTKANTRGILCGRTESELLDSLDNIKQEISCKLDSLKNPLIISSPSERAQQTASIFDKKIIVNKGFREFDFGDFDGKTFEYIKQYHKEEFEKLLKDGNVYQYPNGENLDIFFHRVSKTYEATLLEYKNYKEIVIVSHAGVMQVLLSYLLSGSEALYWNFRIKNCAVAKIYYCEGMPIIEYIK